MMNKAIFIASVLMAIAINQVICANETTKNTRLVNNHPQYYPVYSRPQARHYYTPPPPSVPYPYPQPSTYPSYPSESQAISAFGHIGFWETPLETQISNFIGLGFVFFTQESPSSELVIRLLLEFRLNPDSEYIFQFHERTIADHFISGGYITTEGQDPQLNELQLTDRCLAYAGNRFSGVGAGINYAPHGDIGKLYVEENGMITSTHRTSEFTLYGENSILGRSFVIFEQTQNGMLSTREPLDLRLPKYSETVYACGPIGILASESPSTVSDDTPSPDYEEPRVGLAIIGGSMVGLSNQADAWGVVLFEQKNSHAPLNVTGMFSFNQPTRNVSVEISVHVGTIDEQFTTSDIETKCGSGGDVFQPEYGLLGGSELYFDLEGGDLYRGVEFSFLDTHYTLFGTESILGRSLQFHTHGTTPELFLINCAPIGLYTPGNDLYDGLVMSYLRRPNESRIFRDTAYTVFRQYVANIFPNPLPAPIHPEYN